MAGIIDLYANEQNEELSVAQLWPSDNIVKQRFAQDHDGWHLGYKYSGSLKSPFMRYHLDDIEILIEDHEGISVFSVMSRLNAIVEDDDFKLNNDVKKAFTTFKKKVFKYVRTLNKWNLRSAMFEPYTITNIYVYDERPEFVNSLFRNIGCYVNNGVLRFGCVKDDIIRIIRNSEIMQRRIGKLNRIKERSFIDN